MCEKSGSETLRSYWTENTFHATYEYTVRAGGIWGKVYPVIKRSWNCIHVIQEAGQGLHLYNEVTAEPTTT